MAFLRAIEGENPDNEFVQDFQNRVEEIKSDETWRLAYMQSLLRDQDKFDAGVQAGQKEMAKKLLKRGLSPEDIAKNSDLSIEVIKQLQQEICDEHI